MSRENSSTAIEMRTVVVVGVSQTDRRALSGTIETLCVLLGAVAAWAFALLKTHSIVHLSVNLLHVNLAR